MGVPRSSVYQTSHGPLTISMGGEIWLLQILPEGIRGKFSSSCSEINLVCKSDLKPAMAEKLFLSADARNRVIPLLQRSGRLR
jgi:hypothetical protein